MTLPVIPAIEQVDSVQIGTALLPTRRLWLGRYSWDDAKAVSFWVRSRVRISAWNESVGRERLVRNKTRDSTAGSIHLVSPTDDAYSQFWSCGFRHFGQYHGAGVLTGFGLLLRQMAQR